MQARVWGSSKSALWIGIWICVFGFALGCARVHVESQGGAEALRADDVTIVVLPVLVREAAIESGSGIIERLEARTAEVLASRGYEIRPEAEATLAIQLVAEEQRAVRQTWSSDPDASALVQREFDEAVLALRAIDRRRDVEVWRGEARTRLRDRDLLFSGGPGGTWMKSLETLLARVPSR